VFRFHFTCKRKKKFAKKGHPTYSETLDLPLAETLASSLEGEIGWLAHFRLRIDIKRKKKQNFFFIFYTPVLCCADAFFPDLD
jgi:hypothetical protein